MATGLPRNQALVLAALRESTGRALSAYDLLGRLSPAGLRGPQTIYRALEALRGAGLVHRIESLNAFTACAHAGHAHAHRPAFAVCRACAAVTELEDAPLAAALAELGARTGFSVEDRVIELVGACPGCRRSGAEGVQRGADGVGG